MWFRESSVTAPHASSQWRVSIYIIDRYHWLADLRHRSGRAETRRTHSPSPAARARWPAALTGRARLPVGRACRSGALAGRARLPVGRAYRSGATARRPPPLVRRLRRLARLVGEGVGVDLLGELGGLGIPGRERVLH